jgi:hypothetical protein
MFLFYKHDSTPVNIKLGDLIIRSESESNVLEVTFDSKLQRSNLILSAIKKSTRALNAIKLIRKYFNKYDLLQLLISNFNSLLYYNAEIRLSDSLYYTPKKQHLSASGKAPWVALRYRDPLISYIQLHRIANRVIPNMFCKYRLAFQLLRTFNDQLPEIKWLDLNFVQTNTRAQFDFKSMRPNNLLVGLNINSKRFNELNNTIPLDWFNRQINSFKILCKNKFLPFMGKQLWQHKITT